MTEFSPGDVVVLKSGSMRMLVERVDGDGVAVVWANDGGIGRDTLPAFALNRWEDRGPPRDDRPARPPRAPRGDGDSKPYGDKRGAGPRKPSGDRPARTGMDGRPKAKTFYRKDD